jgi:hypothetical protein
MSLVVKDSLDKTLPEINKEIILRKPGSNEEIIINPRVAKKAYEQYAATKEKAVFDFFKEQNVDYSEFMTDKDFAFTLATFIKHRTRNK